VIYNGVDAERFAAGERAELAKLAPQLSRAKAVVGTVGNMKRQKRHDLFLRAIAAARRDMAGLHGVIVGRDLGEEPSLRKLRAELGLEEHVHFAGGVTDTAPWLRAFDLFLLTSDHEGLPNVVLESMAAGCPVVATDVGGVREIIRDGQSGVIIPRRDEATAAHAIVELLNDRSRRNTIAEEARTRVRQQFSTSAMVEAHVRLYEKLLAPSSV
jgi:glycosyltransferase involved in cell wall biosynthesis